MGKRCRVAALGATFALLVAACAATETPTERTTPAASPSPAPSVSSAPIRFPDSLADAGFVASDESPPCATETSRAVVVDPTDGTSRWAFPIPRPGKTSTVEGSSAYISFGWDGELQPGLGALDLPTATPQWQRFLTTEPESVMVVGDGLLVATNNDVRSIDRASGNDEWVIDSQFDFNTATLTQRFVFVLDTVGVHAIDSETGIVAWQLAINRPDAVIANDRTLVVSAGTRLVAVDIEEKRRLWDTNVDRLGAGQLELTETAVLYEMSTTIAPGGGLAVLDRDTGQELWRSTDIGETKLVNEHLLLASTTNDEPAPAPPFVLLGIDSKSGGELWRIATSAPTADGILGTTANHILTTEPNPVVPDLELLRMHDATTGRTLWDSAIDFRATGASISSTGEAVLFGTREVVGEDRGFLASRNRSGEWWRSATPAGIEQAPTRTPWGLFVVSGERSGNCVGRYLAEPATQGVLGATINPREG